MSLSIPDSALLEILVITRNFPPLAGGMEKVMWYVFHYLGERYVCTIVGPTNSARYICSPHASIECNEASHSAFLATAMAKAWRITARKHFSLVIGGSGFVAPICRLLQARRHIPSLIFVHGLDIVARNPLYQNLWLPCLRRSDVVVTNSANTKRLAEEAGIIESRTVVINPGVERPAISPKRSISFRERLNLGSRRMLLSVGRIIRRKGLLEFVERCMPDLVRTFPDLILIIIGSEPLQAINREPKLVQELEAAVSRLGLAENVLFMGQSDDECLQAAYKEASLAVFPLIDRPGDVEGFGIVAIEAAAHGTPTVAFNCGGIADAVMDGRTGFLVEANNYDEMTAAVTNVLRNDLKNTMSAECIRFSERMSWDRFGEELREVVDSTLSPVSRS